MPKSKTVSLTVTFELPEGATKTEAKEYVLDAVSTWRGSLRPPGSYDEADDGDPMWGLDSDTVKVVLT